jgi:hypothetical protein
MKVLLYGVFLILILISSVYSQSVLLNRTYGGDSYDEANAVQITDDGGFIAAGYTQSFGLGRFGNGYIIRADAIGDTLWTRLFGSDGLDVFADGCVTPDSGFIAVGLTDTPNDYENIYVVKVDKNGNTVFEKNFGGPLKDVGLSVAPADDGGYVITGGTKSFSVGEEDLFLFKINSDGDSLWFKTYGTAGNDPGYGISPADGGGFIVSGLYNWSDAWLLRVDANGDTLWTKTYGGTDYDEANCPLQTADHGYIFCGSTSSIGAGELDAYVVKTDSIGNLIWQKTYGGSGYDEGRRIVLKPTGGYMILANTDSQIPGEFDYYIISTDEKGDTVWTETLGKTGSEERAFDLQNISQTEYIIAGTTFDEVNFNEATITVINDDSAPSAVKEENNITVFRLYDAYPNPFNPVSTIKYSIGNNTSGGSAEGLTTLKIFDILGNEVAVLVNSRQPPGEYEVEFNAQKLSSGIYFYRMQSGKFVQTKKFVLLR